MKLRLSHKLSMVMVGTVFLSAALSAFFISRTTRTAFIELVRENDIRIASILAENVATYYRRENGWSGIKKIIEAMDQEVQSRPAPGMMRGLGQAGSTSQTGTAGQAGSTGQAGGAGQGGPMGMMPYRGPGNRPEIRPELRILITDTTGRVVGHNLNMEVPERLSAPILEKGAPVLVEGSVVGYLFVQSMLETAIGPFQHAFLQRVYRAIIMSMLVVAVLAPVVGLLLMGHITRPLLVLTEAAAAIARGDYSFRPKIDRSDEIGDLSRSFFWMAEEIQSAEEWKKKLIADSAHELRTPVTLLQGNIEMMMEGVYPADREHLRGLFEETHILGRLVKELQELANAESKLTRFNFETIDLKDLFLSILNANRSSAMKAGLEMKIRFPEENVEIYGDRQKLSQVFSNVVQNAIRYTPEGGRILAELYGSGEETEETVVCALEDSGPGIPEEEREKVFERFYRVQQDRNRETGGSGLGLAIAREIVLRHGGSIKVKLPRHLSGARVEIQLPSGKQASGKQGGPGDG